MASDKSYTLDVITAKDEKEVIQFVNRNFFRVTAEQKNSHFIVRIQ